MNQNFIETHRSFVNTWECDENAHMNVQFYLKRFDEAARFFRLFAGDGDTSGALPRVRHVRFHAELAAARSMTIESSVIDNGAFAGWTVHLMKENSSGELSATAIDGPSTGGSGDVRVSEDSIFQALPRSLVAEPHVPRSGDAVLQLGGLVAHRCIVQPGECSANGEMLQQFYISRFTDGAPHAWDHAGIGTRWLFENGFGRVAVELKISHHAAARAGDAVILYSRLETTGEKLLRLYHELVRAKDGAALATGEVVALVLDLKTRKSVALPAEIRDRLSAPATASQG
ncbi:MAG: acyl-ACP thioesterase [Notoacmeibacter sp.]|nr:acyl-ACP thioesterase [Notoacmeibacter sp.]